MNKKINVLHLLRRWWWMLLISLLVPAGGARYLTARQPDYYQARVTLMIGTNLQSAEPDPWKINVTNSLASAYALLVKERPVTEAVIKRLALPLTPEQLAQRITTQVSTEAQLLTLMVVDGNPDTAALIANALADELVRRSPVSGEEQRRRQAFVKAQMDDLEKRIDFLNQEIDKVRASLLELTSAAELEEAQSRLTQLEKSKVDYQTAYAGLLASYSQDSPNIVSVFQQAVKPSSPLPRRDLLIVGVAALGGLALGVAAALLIEYLDDSLRWEGESKRTLLDLPVVGAIPTSRYSNVMNNFDPLSPATEMIRALRTNIFLVAGDRPLRTLLVTSADIQAGKTFTVARLGLAMANSGKQVILVDSDLRRPALHEQFDLPNLEGLSDVLVNPESMLGNLSALLQPSGHPNLAVLTAGKPPIDPSLLLTMPRLKELLQALEGLADVVVIDSPPVMVGPDSTLLAMASDGVVLVVSSGRSTRSALTTAKEQLTEHGDVTLLGVVFNRVTPSSNGYYYYGYGLPRQRRLRRVWKWLKVHLPFLHLPELKREKVDVLALAEVADILGVQRATARRWCQSGRLKAYRSGLRWYVKKDDFRAFVEQFSKP